MSDCGNVQKTFVPTKKEEAKEITKHIVGIEITDVAAEKIKTFVEKENKSISEWGLFIKVTKDGCSGQSGSFWLEEDQCLPIQLSHKPPDMPLKPNQALVVNTPGAGGYGDPKKRLLPSYFV